MGSSLLYETGAKLGDLGEFRILKDVILPIARSYDSDTETGDDCAFVDAGGTLLAASADVGPRPLVQQLPGYESDQLAAGWHAAVATASDIATAGATPLFLTNTVDAPASLEVAQLEQFMDGYFRACKHFEFKNGGGDLREGPTLCARVFGVGLVEHGARIGRAGAESGDHLVLLGRAGAFVASYLQAVRSRRALSPAAERILRFPDVQIRSMRTLAKRSLVAAASDSSDGVLGAIQNLLVRSCCAARLDLAPELLSAEVDQEARLGGFSPWNLFFFWGDWSVVAAIRPSKYDEFVEVATKEGVTWLPLGRAVDGPCRIEAVLERRLVEVLALRNENFVRLGFNAGVLGHVQAMLSTQLFSDRSSGS